MSNRNEKQKELTMKTNQNKSVYVTFDSIYSAVSDVFSSNRTINKMLKSWVNEIYDFAKSEGVKVTVNRGQNSFGDREICIDHNVPSYGLTIMKAEIENSENITLENISRVWISWSIYDPGTCQVHLTQEEGLTYLKSISCLQSNGSPIEGTSLEEFEIKH